jgi:hypothetical protein
MAGILSRAPDAAKEFSSSAILPALLPALGEACARAGFTSDGAELLRIDVNAIYQLADAQVVVRIARSADRLRRVERELCIARWPDASTERRLDKICHRLATLAVVPGAGRTLLARRSGSRSRSSPGWSAVSSRYPRQPCRDRCRGQALCSAVMARSC